MNSDQTAAIAAVVAALVALGIPKAWDLLKMRLGADADNDRMRMTDAISQRGEWRQRVEKLEVDLDAMREAYDRLQASYYELKMEHQECLARTTALEERLKVMEES